jgi:hypothetical protein
MASKPCKICELATKTTIAEDDNKLIINDTPPKIIQHDMQDEDEEEKENSLLLNNLDFDKIINNKPVKLSTKFKDNDIDVDDDLIEIKFTNNKTKNSIQSQDTVYLDSDGESGIVLVNDNSKKNISVENDNDEYYSPIPIFKNKQQTVNNNNNTNSIKSNFNDCFDTEELSFKETKNNKNNYDNDDDDDLNIEDVDFGEISIMKPSYNNPQIKPNSNKYTDVNKTEVILQSTSNQTGSSTSTSTAINIHDKLENKHGVTITELSKYPQIKWLFDDIKDSSPHYHRLDYPHSEDMLITFRNLFGLRQFRPQQFEAVNAALTGINCNSLFIIILLKDFSDYNIFLTIKFIFSFVNVLTTFRNFQRSSRMN